MLLPDVMRLQGSRIGHGCPGAARFVLGCDYSGDYSGGPLGHRFVFQNRAIPQTAGNIGAGAVMVLFLFVIMLLNIKEAERRHFRWLGVIGGVIVAGAFAWELAIILRRPVESLNPGKADFGGGLEAVVKPLFANYMLPFEVTALLLLVAMIGVVLLSKKELK